MSLLCSASGFSLAVHLFERNKTQTKTLIPVQHAFQAAHQVMELAVVADASMMSAANLLVLQDADLSCIVGSRAANTPYDLADHFRTKGNAFNDRQSPGARRPPAAWALESAGGPDGSWTSPRSNSQRTTTGRLTR